MEEPEVLLVDNLANTDKEQSCGRQVRPAQSETKKRAQAKKLQEKVVVKQEPDENDANSGQHESTNEIEVRCDIFLNKN